MNLCSGSHGQPGWTGLSRGKLDICGGCEREQKEARRGVLGQQQSNRRGDSSHSALQQMPRDAAGSGPAPGLLHFFHPFLSWPSEKRHGSTFLAWKQQSFSLPRRDDDSEENLGGIASSPISFREKGLKLQTD